MNKNKIYLSIALFFFWSHSAWAQGVITGSISVSVQDNDVTLVYTVENIGDAPTFVSAPYFVNLAQAPNQDAPDGWIDLDVLAAGESHDEIVALNDLAPGMYYAWLVADVVKYTQGTCGEGCMIGPMMYMVDDPTQEDPNLSISTFSVQVENTLSFVVEVTNTGTIPTGQSTFLDLYLDEPNGAPTPGDTPNAFETIPALDPQETATLQFNVELPQPGTYSAYVVADPYNEIAEEDENDNVDGPLTYEVVNNSQIGDAELVTSNFELTALSADEIEVSCTVTNTGTGQSGNFHWAIYLNPDGEPTAQMESTATVATVSLEPGESVILTRVLSVFSGNHEVWVWADALQVVNESNEDNNWAGPKYVAVGLSQGEADLVIETMTATIGSDNSVTYEVFVRNLGLDPTGAFDVDVIFDSEQSPTLAMSPFPEGAAIHDPEGLMPGAERTYSLVWEQAQEGIYSSWAVVDITNIVEETDETNNTLGPEQIEIDALQSGVDLTIDLFRVQVEGNSIIYEVFLRNTGNVDAPAFDIGVFYDRSEEDSPQLGDEADHLTEVEGLPAGTEISVGFIWESVQDGSYQSWVWLDLSNEVEELNETNNRAGPRFAVVDSDASACEAGIEVEEVCVCDAQTVYTGYCCADGWSSTPCNAGTNPDAGSIYDAGSYSDWTLPEDVELHPSAYAITENSGGCSLTGF